MRPHAWHDTSASAASDKWAEAYWDRQTPTSFKGHQQLFEAFSAAKLRVRNRNEADRFLADQAARTNPGWSSPNTVRVQQRKQWFFWRQLSHCGMTAIGPCPDWMSERNLPFSVLDGG
jgi:hypothetical protein